MTGNDLLMQFQADIRWEPRMSSDERAVGVAAWRRAVDRTLGLVDTERATVGLSGAKA